MTILTRSQLYFNQLPSTEGELYAPAASTQALIQRISVFNSGTSTETVIFKKYDGTNTYTIGQYSILAKEAYDFELPGVGLIIPDGGSIRGYTTTATTVTCSIYGTIEGAVSIGSSDFLEFNDPFDDSSIAVGWTQVVPDGGTWGEDTDSLNLVWTSGEYGDLNPPNYEDPNIYVGASSTVSSEYFDVSVHASGVLNENHTGAGIKVWDSADRTKGFFLQLYGDNFHVGSIRTLILPSTFGTATGTQNNAWLRVIRLGDTFHAYYDFGASRPASLADWTYYGSETISTLTAPVVGLFSYKITTATAWTAEFKDFKFEGRITSMPV